jgi:predicted AlkP superfamily pyrophosphatase or phosphodiesterase
MLNVRRSLVVTALLCTAIPATVTPAMAAPSEKRPKLVVEIVVDQMRADYLDRFDDLFLPPGNNKNPGGFRWLRERGADFAAARYPHFPLFTAPGHAVVATGGYPYKNGIVGNDWYDQAARAPMYSVSDASATVISDDPASKAKPMSPRNLRSSTTGDELKIATGGKAKVVSLSLKDRTAIILGGRLSDTSIWFDTSTGRWISSNFYCKSGQLPAWVHTVNTRGLPASRFGQNWTSTLAPEVVNRGWKPATAPHIHPVHGLGESFPHAVRGTKDTLDSSYFNAWTLTPWANDFVLGTAEKAIESEGLGQDGIPDLLAINLATNDYVGHAFGPDSPEVVDITVQTDRRLAQFFRTLNQKVPGGLDNVTIVLTADHGVAPVPENAEAGGFPAHRLPEEGVVGAAQKALTERFGAGQWVLEYVEPSLYLDDQAIERAKIDPAEAQLVAARAVAKLDGIYAAFTKSQIQEGRLPQNDIGARIAKAYYPKVSGDVMVVTEGFNFIEGKPFGNNTTHGTMYSYDTRVPLLMAGFGIKNGRFNTEVSPGDIAPTLSLLLGTAYPSACDGVPLAAAMR